MPWGPPTQSSSHLRMSRSSPPFPSWDRRRGRKSLRGPTDPVSSRAFLELILFVGCQPVAGEAGLGKGDIECETGNRWKKDREKETKREKDGRRLRRRGENEKERREVHGTQDWTQAGQDQTAINSPLDLSYSIPSMGPRGYYYPREYSDDFLGFATRGVVPIISTL